MSLPLPAQGGAGGPPRPPGGRRPPQAPRRAAPVDNQLAIKRYMKDNKVRYIKGYIIYLRVYIYMYILTYIYIHNIPASTPDIVLEGLNDRLQSVVPRHANQ